MKYISIGMCCNVKYQIDNHKHKDETLFFDWLMISMNSVVEILSTPDINNILYFDNITRDVNIPYHNKNSSIVIKSLDYCVSIHDLLRDYTDSDVFEYIDKYKRRYDRIMEYIKSDEKICFIRDDSSNSNSVVDNNNIRQKFVETILKINPNCKFTLVIIDNKNENDSEILKYDHCLHIKLNINPPKYPGWTTTFLNWEKIFSDIENNI